jgi:ribonuclease M5
MLKEVIIVEGKMDTVAVRRAVDAETIETGGFALRNGTLAKIKGAYLRRGIIILTDPDGAGQRIRSFLTDRFPNAGQAFVPKKDARTPDDVGIEQASPEAIRLALSKVRYHQFAPKKVFTEFDLFTHGLSGDEASARKRDALGAELGIGYGNAKRFLQRLNDYGVTREEFAAALAQIEKGTTWTNQ